MFNWKEKRRAAAAYVRRRFSERLHIGLVLGSGLGSLADEIADGTAIPYSEVPHFPVSTVEGHSGRLVLGTLEGKVVAAMQYWPLSLRTPNAIGVLGQTRLAHSVWPSTQTHRM